MRLSQSRDGGPNPPIRIMTHNFAFEIHTPVIALDYDEPRREHHGIILRRWLEENPRYMEQVGLLERYEVLLDTPGPNSKHQIGEFLQSDLRSVN